MSQETEKNTNEEVTDKIFTVPNVITFIRLIMVPIAFVFLLMDNNIVACALFATAALTDFLDGQIARRTHCVSKLGQILDPAVDRLLMIAGVLGLLITGRLPLWIVILVVVRDLFLLLGGMYLLKRYKSRVPVVYAGKVATTFLFTGFAALILYMPLTAGLGLVSVSWLPGFSGDAYCWGIWLVYIGLIIALFTTVLYVVKALRLINEDKAATRG